MQLFDADYGIAEWLPVLNWEKIPDLGPCHNYAASGEEEEFLHRYVITEELRNFCGTLLLKLKTKRIGHPVVMLEGDPGIGKTTLVYALKAHVTNDAELNSAYTFYACHANCIDNPDWEREILYHSKQALKALFSSCNQLKLLNQICADESDDVDGLRVQINRLKTCIAGEKHRNKFKKTLVFVLDNVDTVTDSERVIEAFELINKILEPSIIKKWIVVRPETVRNYSIKQKKRIESFISDHLTMPRVSLFDVVKKRISKTTGNKSKKINPFGPDLCDELVLPLCNGNLRKGLSVLEAVLRDTPPKGFADRKTDKKIIRNYLRKCIVPVLFKENLLVNLHDIRYSIKSMEAPMAYDLLCLTKYSSQQRHLLSMLYDAIDRRNKSLSYSITGRENKYTIYDHDLDNLLTLLSQDGLVIWDKRQETVILTALGNAHINIATQSYYAQLCEELGAALRSSTYWAAAEVDVSHASVAKAFSTTPLY